MGITSKQTGKFRGMMRKIENEQLKIKADSVKRKKKENKMCCSSDCPKRSHCYRAQAKPDKLQSYSDFSAECFQYNFLRFWSMSGKSDEMKGNNDE